MKSTCREYTDKKIGQNGEKSSTIDNKILSQKTGKNAVIHTKEGDVLIKSDGGKD